MNFHNSVAGLVRPYIPLALQLAHDPELADLAVERRSVIGRDHAVWIMCEPGVGSGYRWVENRMETEGRELSAYDALKLRTFGICTEVVLATDQVEVMASPQVGLAIAGGHLWPVAQEGFSFSMAPGPAGTPPRVWFRLVLSRQFN